MFVNETSVFFLFELEQCVFYELSQYTHDISKKFEYFVFQRKNCITKNDCIIKNDVANSLYEIYDKKSIIECELIVYGLDYIVHIALHDK